MDRFFLMKFSEGMEGCAENAGP